MRLAGGGDITCSCDVPRRRARSQASLRWRLSSAWPRVGHRYCLCPRVDGSAARHSRVSCARRRSSCSVVVRSGHHGGRAQPLDVAASDPQAREINRNGGGSQGLNVVHVVPVTTTRRGFRSEIDLKPDDANGLSEPLAAQCQHVRCPLERPPRRLPGPSAQPPCSKSARLAISSTSDPGLPRNRRLADDLAWRPAPWAHRTGRPGLSALSIGYPTSPMVPSAAGWRTIPVMV